jgi:hypothetical protein
MNHPRSKLFTVALTGDILWQQQIIRLHYILENYFGLSTSIRLQIILKEGKKSVQISKGTQKA